jgi:hypothetical protein
MAREVFEAALGAAVLCACLVVLHRAFECAKSGCAKLGYSAKLGCARGARGWQCTGAVLLLLSVPTATAATLPIPDGVASSSVDFSYVTPGTFDKPLDFLGAPEGGHRRALSCVRARMREPSNLRFIAPMGCLLLLTCYE